MTIFRILLSQTSIKQLNRLDPIIRSRIKKSLKEVAKDPFTSRSGCDIKQLHGKKRDFYRLRVGDYRVVYAITGKDVKVIEIRHTLF